MAAPVPFSGIYPMLYAFFGRDGLLDREAMHRQVQACVRSGAHGLAALGLATEVSKLSRVERRQVVEWATQDAGGAVPVAITVSEPTVDAQVNFARWAKERGASWVILQPPPERGMPEEWYVEFFAATMERIELPCAIQNAPEYIGVGLGPESIKALQDRCPNFRTLRSRSNHGMTRASPSKRWHQCAWSAVQELDPGLVNWAVVCSTIIAWGCPLPLIPEEGFRGD